MLLTFFSRAGENYGVDDTEVGNTEVIAGYIKDYFGDKIDVFKLEPVNPPAFQGEVDLSAHDTIFLGYPIWWGEPPMIINTFLEKYDFVGKTIIPFNTHAGSGTAGSYEAIKEKLSDANVNTNGLAIMGTDVRTQSAKGTVEAWLKELGF